MPQLSADPLGRYWRNMKLKLTILSILLSAQLFSQHSDSMFVGKWVCTEIDSFPSRHRIVDVWRIHQNSYDDTVYHIYPDGRTLINGISQGLWYAKVDTIFTLDTLIFDSKGTRVYYDNKSYRDYRITKIDSMVFIVDSPSGIAKYLKQQ
jgi:hypothetical protein